MIKNLHKQFCDLPGFYCKREFLRSHPNIKIIIIIVKHNFKVLNNFFAVILFWIEKELKNKNSVLKPDFKSLKKKRILEKKLHAQAKKLITKNI